MTTATLISEKVKEVILEAYHKAKDTWPNITWTNDHFQNHLGLIADKLEIHEDDFCDLHLPDVYIAGAAGHRIESAWQVIDEDFGPKVMHVLKKLPKADYSLEELWADTRLRQIEEDQDADLLPDDRKPARIGRFAGRVPLLNYLVTVARRLAIQRHKKHKPDVGLVHETDDDKKVTPQFEDDRESRPDEPMQSGEVAGLIQKAIVNAFRSLSRDRQLVIALVVRDQLKQKVAADLLGWSESKVNRQLEPALKVLWQAMQELNITESENNQAPKLRTMMLAFRAYFSAIENVKDFDFPMK